ncbi:uncharacterized protein LOC132303262 [Cornus florida]|uniref:uncharacterized protein LOC132303262 n=1 Tax=Cornus florida TaxID=4283 RepID=UPI00289D2D75|nr:uncharacterized protein LOC132303262 [Cornus florida]
MSPQSSVIMESIMQLITRIYRREGYIASYHSTENFERMYHISSAFVQRAVLGPCFYLVLLYQILSYPELEMTEGKEFFKVSRIYHAVLVVRCDIDKLTADFIFRIQNSWGTEWSEDGFTFVRGTVLDHASTLFFHIGSSRTQSWT